MRSKYTKFVLLAPALLVLLATTTNGLHKTMATMLQTARTEPLLAEWPEIQTTLEAAINEMAGGADVKTTLDKAQKDVDEIMKRAGYYK